jgi:peptidoglycan lytic transglycosylase
LSGKHAEERSPRPSRKSLPLLAGAAVVAVIIGTAVATLRFTPAASTTTDAIAAPPVAAAPPADRTQQRADRSEQRITAAPETTPSPSPSSPSPSPSPKPKPTRSTTAPQPPSGGGAVVSSGTCQASFYDTGTRTASGEPFDVHAFTAAHRTLPFNTKVRVTNVSNGKSVVVRINDRGPFVSGRCLDLTPAAFDTISSESAGVATVKFEVLAS